MTRAAASLFVLAALLAGIARAAPPHLPTSPAEPRPPMETPPSPLPPSETRLPHPLGDGYLLRPGECRPTCSLVIVSHSRGMTADVSLTRPHLRRLFEKLVTAGFAVIVSNDGGPNSWGSLAALTHNAELRAKAIEQFPFSGRTYTLGYSMGALPALLSAYRGVFPVAGVAMIDGRVNLLDAWQGSDLSRRKEIAVAHGVAETDPLPVGIDPLNDFTSPEALALPVFVAGSPQDQTAPLRTNGEILMARSTSKESRFVPLTGAHLGASHFGDPVLDGIVAFYERLEHLERHEARRSPIPASGRF